MSITALRAKREAISADIKNKEATVKNLDKQQRAIRGDIAKLKNQWRDLSTQITKLAKDEL